MMGRQMKGNDMQTTNAKSIEDIRQASRWLEAKHEKTKTDEERIQRQIKGTK
jgi:hypothetical protein